MRGIRVFAKRMLNANRLKAIAVFAMVLDHCTTLFIPAALPLNPLFHAVGQIAAPIMCFFIAEGYFHTANPRKYLLRLFLFAVLSHVPYALCFHFNIAAFWQATSVMWPLFLGLLAVLLWERLPHSLLRILSVGFCCLLAYPGNWNYIAVLWIVAFSVFRECAAKKWIAFSAVSMLYVLQYYIYGSLLPLWLRFFVLAAIPLLMCYNHTRGKRSKALQWGYYLFYPLHFLVLYAIRSVLTSLG